MRKFCKFLVLSLVCILIAGGVFSLFNLSHKMPVSGADTEIGNESGNASEFEVKSYTGLQEINYDGFWPMYGDDVWTDGDRYYCSSIQQGHHFYDIGSCRWDNAYWNGYSFEGCDVWTDGYLIYYSHGSIQYEINPSCFYCCPVTYWQGLEEFYGEDVWSDGVDYYCFNENGQYVLDVENHTWIKLDWNGFAPVHGNYVWNDGVDYYYSCGNDQYIIDVENRTCIPVVWSGFENNFYFIGCYVWTDGVDYYCSRFWHQYVLNVKNRTWVKKEWNNFEPFTGENVWSDGFDYYCFDGNAFYVFTK